MPERWLSIKRNGGSLSPDRWFKTTRIIQWLRRRKNDQKTMCELFYACCDDMQDIELGTALKQLLKILCDGTKNHAIAITSEVKMQLISWFVSQLAFIKALYLKFMWEF